MKTKQLLAVCALVLFSEGVFSQEATVPSAENCPCCQPEHQAFDFWIGVWEVRNADGVLLGTNRIERLQGGCLLQEHWVSATGVSTGTSMNYYNRILERWEQVWVDNGGNVLKLYGNRLDNQMVLTSEPFTAADGSTRRHRISWTLRTDGSVRQVWEVLREDEVVQILFDGMYTR